MSTRLRACLPIGMAFILLATPAPAEPIPDGDVPGVLAALIGNEGPAARAAVARIREARDERFTAVFIELLRAALAGMANPAAGVASIEALHELTDQRFGEDWHAWVEWYAGTALEPPPGFTSFKGELLGRIDLRFAALLRDEHPSRIRSEEIVWGGVPFEGIPALDDPKTVAADEAGYLTDEEPVFGVALDGEARAYPLRLLDWHEMANDRLGGVAFSLTYCTLCGTAMAYRGDAPNGERYDFGSSGLLMRSNKLMVDRQTRTLWNQFTGRPVLGPLASQDWKLTRVPVVVTRWQDWRERHPQTTVLSIDTGHDRPYELGAAYGGYFASDDTMFPVRVTSRKLAKKARIFGLEIGGVAKAYPIEALVAQGIVHDRVGEQDVVLLAPEPMIEVQGRSVRSGPARYFAGAAVRAYRTDGRRFVRRGDELKDTDGHGWNETENALIGPDGARLERIPGSVAFWFGWNAHHPRGSVYEAESNASPASAMPRSPATE